MFPPSCNWFNLVVSAVESPTGVEIFMAAFDGGPRELLQRKQVSMSTLYDAFCGVLAPGRQYGEAREKYQEMPHSSRVALALALMARFGIAPETKLPRKFTKLIFVGLCEYGALESLIWFVGTFDVPRDVLRNKNMASKMIYKCCRDGCTDTLQYLLSEQHMAGFAKPQRFPVCALKTSRLWRDGVGCCGERPENVTETIPMRWSTLLL